MKYETAVRFYTKPSKDARELEITHPLLHDTFLETNNPIEKIPLKNGEFDIIYDAKDYSKFNTYCLDLLKKPSAAKTLNDITNFVIIESPIIEKCFMRFNDISIVSVKEYETEEDFFDDYNIVKIKYSSLDDRCENERDNLRSLEILSPLQL